MNNVSILRIVVIGLVIGFLILVAGMFYLIANDKMIPNTVETLTTAIVTGMLGLLVPRGGE